MHTRVDNLDRLVEPILDALPTPVYVVDDQLRILGFNEAGSLFANDLQGGTLEQLCGHVLRCLNERTSEQGCGQTDACTRCEIRNAVTSCWELGRAFRRRHEFQRLGSAGEPETLHLLVTASPLEAAGQKLAVVVLEDVSDITRLHQILPICAGCKRIRDDEDAWHEVEVYVSDHTDVRFSHGYCQECAAAAMEGVLSED